MKSIILFALGIILGILCINTGVAVITDLKVLAIVPALIDGLLTYAFFLGCKKCFAKM